MAKATITKTPSPISTRTKPLTAKDNKKNWNTAVADVTSNGKQGDDDVPPGRYVAEVTNTFFGTMKKGKNVGADCFSINYRVKNHAVTGSTTSSGSALTTFFNLAQPKSCAIAKGIFEQLGHTNVEYEDIPAVVKAIKDKRSTVVLNVVHNDGTGPHTGKKFQNVFFSSVVAPDHVVVEEETTSSDISEEKVETESKPEKKKGGVGSRCSILIDGETYQGLVTEIAGQTATVEFDDDDVGDYPLDALVWV